MFSLNERSERPGSMRLEALIGANLPAARPLACCMVPVLTEAAARL